MSIPSTVKCFGQLCEQVTNEPSLTIKEEIIRGFVSRFSGNLTLLAKLLLPKYANRIYYAQEKQLIRVLSVVLCVPEDDLKTEWNKNGCVAETAQKFFKPTASVDSSGWCKMTLDTFDEYLNKMAAASTETNRIDVVTDFLKHACGKTVYLFFRELKQDMRLGAGLRIVLAGLHPNAYQIFQHTANLEQVVEQIKKADTVTKTGSTGQVITRGVVSAQIKLGVPLAPMLAAPSKSIDYVLSKCPNGAFSEVKYDGERIQIHKQNGVLSFFARSLKPMQPAKYAGLEKYINEAVEADSCILDGEILMVDIKTSIPLPFGTLGSHKRNQFASACPCVFLFDILYLNGQSLLNMPLEDRREEMKKAVRFTRNRVMFSELCLVKGDMAQRRVILQKHLNRAIAEGLEGLVIKDVKGTYEPRARHWVKLKKDYLEGLADSADLLVLGAWYGSGNKGGQLSTFLMGCVDTSVPEGSPGRYKTVCKVGNGLKDTAISILSKKYSSTMEPMRPGKATWLRTLHVPDVVLKDPKTADVMEIIGAEFSVTKHHTSGMSIRFPRIIRVRSDKTVDTATSCQELLELFRASKEKATSAGISDSLELIDNYAILDEHENSNPPIQDEGAKDIPSPPVAAEQQEVFAPLPPFSYVQGADATNPAVPATANVVLAHSVAAGGQWSVRGFMGQITKRYGAEAQKAYDQSIAERALGDVVVTEVGPASREGRIFIASLVAQEPAPSGQIPLMNNSALQKCLGHCVDFCSRQSASLHLVKPAPGTEVNWAEVEVFLKEKSASKKVHVLVYGADPHSTSHPNPEVKRPRADSAGEWKEIESVTEKKPKREVSAEDKSNRNGDFFTMTRGRGPLFYKLKAQLVMPYGGSSIETAEMVTTNGGEVVCVSPQYNKDVPCNIVVLQVCPETNNTLTILEKADVPVVNQEWVTDCVRYSTIMDPSVYHRAKGEVLRGYQVQIPKGEPLRTEWERLATLMGATVSNDSPDALVVTTRPTGQYIDANLSASTVVHPRWLTDCALAQTALSTKNYGLSTMRQSLVDEDDEDDISNCSTETYVYDNEESNSKK